VLSFMKARVNKRVMVAAEEAHLVKHEESNAKLVAELEQTHLVLAEAEAGQNSLSMELGKLEEECAGLRAAVDTLGQQKVKAVADHQAENTTTQKKFQDYRVHRHKKLPDLRVNLEKAVNEIGVRCLSYPGKNTTIGEIVEWFDKEIRALPGAIFKANKSFFGYGLVGVLTMLYENAYCGHVAGLETIMNSCDASILDVIPEVIAKLSGHITKRWWTSHGLPYVTNAFRVVPEVRMFATCCGVWRLLILTPIFCVNIGKEC
jgi:hypothetical protein